MKSFLKTVTPAFFWVMLVPLQAQTPAGTRNTLPEAEQKILQAIQTRTSQFSDTLAGAVKISSPTQNLEGVAQVGAYYRKQFEELGLTTSWISMPPEMKRAGHLVAEQKGEAGKRVLLIGHMDTVLPGGTYGVNGTTAKGSGTSDDKGGNLIILETLRALKRVGALESRRIVVFLTGDEENAGDPIEVSRRDLIEVAKRSDVALSFESSAENKIVVGRRGASSWELVAQGATGHSSGIFGAALGDGAIYEASRILNSFRDTLGREKGLTFNPSLIVGGTQAELTQLSGSATGKDNIVAQRAMARGDLRFLSNPQLAHAKEVMEKIATTGNLRRTSATLSFFDRYPAMESTPANLELMHQLSAVSESLGYGPLIADDPLTRGAGDVSFVAPILPSIDGLGCRGHREHAPDESVDLASIPEMVERTALLVYRLTR